MSSILEPGLHNLSARVQKVSRPGQQGQVTPKADASLKMTLLVPTYLPSTQSVLYKPC